MDFLHHEVLITALFRRFSVPGNLSDRLLIDISVQIIHLNRIRCQANHLVVVHIDDFSGVLQDGRHVRGKEILSLTDTQYHRAVFARRIDLTGIILKHNRQRV